LWLPMNGFFNFSFFSTSSSAIASTQRKKPGKNGEPSARLRKNLGKPKATYGRDTKIPVVLFPVCEFVIHSAKNCRLGK